MPLVILTAVEFSLYAIGVSVGPGVGVAESVFKGAGVTVAYSTSDSPTRTLTFSFLHDENTGKISINISIVASNIIFVFFLLLCLNIIYNSILFMTDDVAQIFTLNHILFLYFFQPFNMHINVTNF